MFSSEFVNVSEILVQLGSSLQVIFQAQWKASHLWSGRRDQNHQKTNWIDLIKIKFHNSLKLKQSIYALMKQKLVALSLATWLAH